MPTLVRIRGKSGPPDSAETQPSKRKPGTRRRAQSTRQLSPLEALPTEIAQEIYCYGTNLDLPLASPVLFTKLRGRALQQKVVARLAPPYFPGANAELQTRLVQQEWFDLDLLNRHMHHNRAAVLLADVKEWLKHSPRHVLEREMQRANRFLNQVFEQTHSLCCWQAYGPLIILDKSRIVRLWCSPHTAGAWLEDSMKLAARLSADPFLFARGCEIPSRLLRPPWNRDRAVLLARLYQYTPRSRPGGDGFIDPDAIALGLIEAIRQRCWPVLDGLTSNWGVCEFTTLRWADQDGLVLQDSHVNGCDDGRERSIEETLSNTRPNEWTACLGSLPPARVSMHHLEVCLRESDGRARDEDIFKLLAIRGHMIEMLPGEVLTLLLRMQAETSGAKAELIERLRGWVYREGKLIRDQQGSYLPRP